MLNSHNLVFDDYLLPAPAPPGPGTFTSDRWNEELGRSSAIAVTAVIDDIGPGGPGTFHLNLIHSADNKNWFVRSVSVEGDTWYYGDILLPSIASGGQYMATFADGCQDRSWLGSTAGGPLHPFVRFSMYTTVVRAHVKLYVTCRGAHRW
jgi:hypothetical protein